MHFEQMMDWYYGQLGHRETLEFQCSRLQAQADAINRTPDEYRSVGVANYQPTVHGSGISDPTGKEGIRHADQSLRLMALSNIKEAGIAEIDIQVCAITRAVEKEDTINRRILSLRFDFRYSLEKISIETDISVGAIRGRLKNMAERIPRLARSFEDGSLKPVARNWQENSRPLARRRANSLVLSL